MEGIVIGIICVVAIVLFIACFCVLVSNDVNRAIVKIDESKSGIEIQLKRRYDILTQSLEIAKGYMKHEEKIFTNLRSVNSGMGISEINEALENQSKCSKELFALAEEYPELRSEKLFSNLQNQLSEENAQLSASKRAFNANVTRLNMIVVSFPSSVVCSMKGQKEMEFIHEENLDDIKEVELKF